MNDFCKIFLTVFTFLFIAFQSQAEEQNNGSNSNVVMILDGSNSMWGQIDGTAKITIAKDVLIGLINDLDAGTAPGLIVYGHRQKGDCKDIEIVSTPGFSDKEKLIDKVQSITPKGKTPITDSIGLAAATAGVFGGDAVDVVLVSDGLETCDADPCAYAKFLKQTNVNFKTHIIGFDVTDVEFKQLQCIATETGGKFFRANNASQLQEALKKTVEIASGSGGSDSKPTPTPNTKAEAAKPEAAQFLYAKLCETCEREDPLEVSWNVYKDGRPFYSGLGVIFPDDPMFEAGKYEVAARFKSSHVTAKGDIEFGADGKQIGELNLNGGSAVLFAYATDDKTIAADPIFYQFFPFKDGEAASEALAENASSNSVTWLPAGRYKVLASHDQVKESAEIEIVAGQETKYAFDMRVGYFQPSAVLTSGSKLLGGDVDYAILQTEKSANDPRANGIFVLGAFNEKQPLKPGKYYVRAMLSHKRSGSARLDRVFPIEIKANEVSQPVFDMNAGILSHTIKSSSNKRVSFVRYIRAEDNREVGGGINGSHAVALSPGIYYLRVFADETYNTESFEIFAGKTTMASITIP